MLKKLYLSFLAITFAVGLSACGANVNYETAKAETSLTEISKTIDHLNGLENVPADEVEYAAFNLKSSAGHLKALMLKLEALKNQTEQSTFVSENQEQYISGQLDAYILMLQAEIRLTSVKCEYYMQKYI